MTRTASDHLALGADPVEGGVRFRVWAPAAHQVELQIEGRRYPMAAVQQGVWTAELNGCGPGTRYGYLVDGQGEVFKKVQPADPTNLPLVTGLTREQYVQDPASSAARFRDALAVAKDYAPLGEGTDALSEVRVSDRFPELLVGAHALRDFVLLIDQRSKAVALCR